MVTIKVIVWEQFFYSIRKELVALIYESAELSYRIKMLRKDAHAETEGKIFLQESY